MDNISYHGTSDINATVITGPPANVNVDLGKGELGKGFYTGSSIALAAIWAQNRYKEEAVVIEFEIPKAVFVKLKGTIIKNKKGVEVKWAELKKLGLTTTHIFDMDYVIAPFATIEHTGYQFKFESKNAENALNSSIINIYSCVS